MKQFLLSICLLFLAGSAWGQTTVNYDFSEIGAVTGLSETSPGISLDSNIGFGSFKNSGTSNPAIVSSQLRLYQNTTKGGSIKVYASNGVTITDVVIHSSGTTGPAAYSVDGVGNTAINISGGTYSITGISATSEVEFWCTGSASGTRVYVDNFDVTYTGATPTVTIANTGSPSAGDILQGTSDAVLFGFSLTPSASVDFTEVSVATSGTATTDDVSNFRLILDANDNGAYDGGETVVQTLATLANPLVFDSFSNAQNGLSAETRYLVVADFDVAATVGRTLTLSIDAATDVNTTGDESGTATGNTQTIISASAPVITLTGTLSAFGNTVSGTSSSSQSYSVEGVNLTDDITITPPSGFEVSTDDAIFNTSVILTEAGGSVSTTTIYVRFSPSSANGNNSGNISHTSTDASQQDQAVSGFAIDTEPTTAASSLSFDTITESSLELSWTRGNGDSVLVIMKSGLSAVDFDPSDATFYATDSTFGNSSELGSGNYAVYSGVGTTVTVTGLSASTTYQVEVFEFNVGSAELTHNYNVSSTLTGNQATSAPTEGLQITTSNTNFTIDFESTVSGVNEGLFASNGASTSPSTGQLNSNTWSVTGMSEGSLSFGGTKSSSTDFSRGVSTGGVTSGGLYAFDTGSNRILGFQPTASDFNPGTLILKIQNQTGSLVNRINISYLIWVYNNEGRSSSISLSYSYDNITYNDISELNLTTTEAADVTPAWESFNKVTSIYGIEISNQSYFYLRWTSTDVAGSGSRDEFGFDDITFNVNSTTNYRAISGTAGWRMLSSPKTGFTVADISDNTAIQGVAGGSNAAADSNFYTYTSEGAWNTPSNVSTPIADGYGFITYFYNNETAGSSLLPITLDVNGTEPGSDVDVTLNTTTEVNGSHFTLVGNPFASNLNTNSITATGGTVQANIQFWNNATSAYVIQDRTGPFIVAPWSGFWVESTDGATSITIPTSGKTASASGTSYFAKEAVNTLTDLKFELQSSYNTDAAIQVQFREQATFGWDLWDASKFTSLNANFALLGFQAETGKNLKAVESLPSNLSEVVEIPMEVLLSGSTQEVNLSWNSLASFPEDWTFTLIDSETSSSINLREVESYAFVIQGSPAKAKGHAQKNPIVSATGNARFTLVVNPGTSTTSVETANGIPSQLELSQNYPNPFNPSTQIQFALPAQSNVRLSVFDMLGREVVVLVNGDKPAGKFTVNFDGSTLSSGMYMYRLVSNGSSITKKLTLIK